MRGLAAGFMDTLRAEWDAAVAQYRNAKLALDTAETELYTWQAFASIDPDDWKEWQEQFARVNAIKSTVDSLESIVARVSGAWGWTRDTFGLSGKRGAVGALGFVGVAPLVIAGVSVSAFLVLVGKVAAVAAGVYAFVQYLSVKQELQNQNFVTDTYNAYVADGIEPARAAELANKAITVTAQSSTGYTFATELRKMMMYAALGLAAVFVLPKLLEHKR